MLTRIRDGGGVSYRPFADPAELQGLVENDLAVLLSEQFGTARSRDLAGSSSAPVDDAAGPVLAHAPTTICAPSGWYRFMPMKSAPSSRPASAAIAANTSSGGAPPAVSAGPWYCSIGLASRDQPAQVLPCADTAGPVIPRR